MTRLDAQTIPQDAKLGNNQTTFAATLDATSTATSTATVAVTSMPNSSLQDLGFAPVINSQTHTLILGSFPGAASLQAQQYYAFKHNQFWRLMSAVLGLDLVAPTYEERLAILLANGIGLWDVYAACVREGSLDSAIQQGELNDFGTLKIRCPALSRLCFNGQTAARMARHFSDQGYATLVLPSSSPAHATLRFDQKRDIWRRIAGAGSL